MKVSLKWLASYVDLRLPPEEIADRLTMSGTEVGGVQRTAAWGNVVVALVAKVEPHPNADRLRLAIVDVGETRHTVVCGAPNIAEGQVVAYASIGAELIDGHTGQPATLKAATIRGVESAGMVCSERELGLSESHEGILVLPPDAPIGMPLADFLGDTILDLDVTPNRPDCMSVLGVAREVAALTGETVREIEPFLTYEEKGPPIKGRATVQIIHRDLCSRYMAALVEGIRLGPSPTWMRERLIAAGMRSINNVVDVTNYVMLELGQPLHAFDFDRLHGGAIFVRRLREGERITTLGGVEHELEPGMLAICDAERPVAIAGVMGGADSEVSEKTTRVLLESAAFSGSAIRRTASRLRLRTEASARFEKGLPPALAEVALRRAVHLLVDVCRGKAAAGVIDVYPVKERDVRVTVTAERMRKLLGIDLSHTQVRSVLQSLGFSCRWVPPDRYVVRVPYWRTDVRIADDVVEELARLIGYDKFPTTALSGSLPEERPQPLRDLRERLRDEFATAGMQEVITYSMISEELLNRALPAEDIQVLAPLRVANPLSVEYELARTSLRPGLLRTLAANLSQLGEVTALFEAARVYLPRTDDLPEEAEMLCGVVSGRLPDRWGMPAGAAADFFIAKGYVEAAFERIGIDLRFAADEDGGLLPGRTAVIEGGMERLGVLGQLDPRIARRFDFPADVFLFEIDVAAVGRALERRGRRYQVVGRFPAVEQDIALIVDAGLEAGLLREAIEATPLVESAAVFDVYEGEPIAKGKKSVAFSVSYRSPDRTLSDEDVARTQKRIVERLAREHGAELRGG